MKYKNAEKILPPELVEEIQKYVQGEFLYVPKKDRQAHKALTEYRVELDKRNIRIYTMLNIVLDEAIFKINIGWFFLLFCHL